MQPPAAGLQALLAPEERIRQIGDANTVAVRAGLTHTFRLVAS